MFFFATIPGANNLLVTTIAGSALATPFADGVGLNATFNSPMGIVLDANGRAYVSDGNNYRVRQIVLATGEVSTLAGSGGASSIDGTGTGASFLSPSFVALDGFGNLYVTEYSGNRVRKVVLATQVVTILAGTGSGSFSDGFGVSAAFAGPRGIVFDTSGTAYVADLVNNRIRKIVLSSAAVTTLAGSATASASNGIGTAAGFSNPFNVVLDSSGKLLFVADLKNNLIRQIEIATLNVTTLAGSGAAGAANGVGVAAQFNGPYGLAVDSSGNLFVSENGNHRIRKIDIATRTVTTIAGSGAAAWADGVGTNAAFNRPTGLAMDARGNIFVTDFLNNRVRVMQPTTPCPLGMYCTAGVTAPASCPPGCYCAAGADRLPCAQGYYCPAGSSSATQIACPTGAFYCPAGASAPVSIECAAGQGLVLGASMCADCTPGFYCAAGSLNVFGFINMTGAAYPSCSFFCSYFFELLPRH